MDLTQDLLKLLFGNLGALGTVCVVGAAYIAWLLHLEQKEHAETREKMDALNEKRAELFQTMVQALAEHRVAMEALASMMRRRRT